MRSKSSFIIDDFFGGKTESLVCFPRSILAHENGIKRLISFASGYKQAIHTFLGPSIVPRELAKLHILRC